MRGRPAKSPEERFWKKVNKNGPNGCWIWTGTKSANYGKILVEGIPIKVHRFSYEIFIGSIPEGLYVLHKCDNKKCVNPNHLEVGTQLKNMQDAWNRNLCSKQKWSKAKKKSWDKKWLKEESIRGLNKETVLAIYYSGDKQQDIADKYKISQSTVSNIRNKKSYQKWINE